MSGNSHMIIILYKYWPNSTQTSKGNFLHFHRTVCYGYCPHTLEESMVTNDSNVCIGYIVRICSLFRPIDEGCI